MLFHSHRNAIQRGKKDFSVDILAFQQVVAGKQGNQTFIVGKFLADFLFDDGCGKALRYITLGRIVEFDVPKQRHRADMNNQQ